MTRIVHCPGCKVLLVEPTAGVPIYQCGKCFMVLKAKHAIQSSLQLPDEALSNDSSSSSSSSTAGPLYRQRNRDQHQQNRGAFPSSGASSSSSSVDNLYESNSSKPLYTSRQHSASKPPLQAQQQGSMMLLQDMRKLAREAFHSGKHQETMMNGNNSQREGEPERKIQEHRLAEENGFGLVGVDSSSRRVSGSDFDFHRQEPEVLADMYAAPAPRNQDYEAPISERREHESTREHEAGPERQGNEASHPGIREYEPSDYHSTLDEFENRSQVSDFADIGLSSRRMDFGSSRVEGRLSFKFEQQTTQRQENSHGSRACVEMLPASPASEKDGPLEDSRYRRLSVSGNSTNSSSLFSEVSSEQVRAPTATNTHIAKKKVNYPRLESPYVICQHCRKLLEVPRHLPPSDKAVQKLRCGACQKISRFSIERSSVNCTDSNHFSASAFGRIHGATDGYLYEQKEQQQQQEQYLTSTAVEYNSAAPSPTSRLNRPESRFKEEQQASASISNNRNGFNSVNHKNNLRTNNLQLDMMIPSTEGSPDRGSAPASFHHGAHPSNVFSSNVVRAGSAFKGYESAPEFQSGDENLPSSSYGGSMHARSDSAASRFPMAPCLHELFGYESPSQFIRNVEHQRQHIQSQHGNHKKPAQKNSPSGNKSGGFKDMLLKSLHDFGKLHFHQHHSPGSAAAAAAVPTKVTVNGQVIPEELVRRAEEQAGPIHPGSYWYDYRAGFWGVMGGPCIGIIPPRIEEFNIPMHAACSGGRTEVFVNGRELHQQDLDVLVKRGLPATPKAAYTIDINGAVMDLATESEIRNLGRLAPSMENRGVGYGMYPLSAGS